MTYEPPSDRLLSMHQATRGHSRVAFAVHCLVAAVCLGIGVLGGDALFWLVGCLNVALACEVRARINRLNQIVHPLPKLPKATIR